jgi:hypothetical protein
MEVLAAQTPGVGMPVCTSIPRMCKVEGREGSVSGEEEEEEVSLRLRRFH